MRRITLVETWTDVLDRLIEQLGGFPGSDEYALQQAWMRHPAAFHAAAADVARRVADPAKPIRKPWFILRQNVEHLPGDVAIPVGENLSTREGRAASWIRRTGCQYPSWDEAAVELGLVRDSDGEPHGPLAEWCGDPLVSRRLREVWDGAQDAADQAERALEERCAEWRAQQERRLVGDTSGASQAGLIERSSAQWR